MTNTKSQLEKIALEDEIRSMDNKARVNFVNQMGVFILRTNGPEVTVSTSMTLSLVNFKRCMKLAGGQYMKSIYFTCDNSEHLILELVDISTKTMKKSQSALDKAKKDRLARKHTPRTSRSSNENAALEHFKELHEDIIGTPWEHNYVPKNFFK